MKKQKLKMNCLDGKKRKLDSIVIFKELWHLVKTQNHTLELQQKDFKDNKSFFMMLNIKFKKWKDKLQKLEVKLIMKNNKFFQKDLRKLMKIMIKYMSNVKTQSFL